MKKNESGNSTENVCRLQYLNEMMNGKKPLIKGVIDVFLIQIPEELKYINDAVAETNYAVIKSYAHTMKSSVSIMGITSLAPILQELEDLGAARADIEKIKALNHTLNLICSKAIEEIEKEKHNYV